MGDIRDAKDIIYPLSASTPKKGAIAESFDTSAVDVLWDNILVRRDRGRDKTDGGLHIPQAFIEPKFTGTILAIGESVACERLKVGVRVLFGKYSGAELEIAGQTCAMMRESDVMAILQGDEVVE
jgi:chaperonin GroES